MASTFKTWFRRSRTTLSEKHFKVIFNNIEHSTLAAKNHKTWLKLLETLNCVNYSMLNPKHNAKHAWRIGTLASSTARADTSYEMIRQRTRSTSSPFLISFRFTTTTLGKVDPTVTATGRRWSRIPHFKSQLQKKCKKRGYLNIHDRFIRDTWFRKTMLELGRTEEVIREMDKLANEDHTYIATEEELNVYRGNWWIRSNFVGSDTMPIRHRPDFKKALSTLHRLKKAEDEAYYHNWWQSSSSSWWQWQDSWWHPSSETSPRRWTWHWLNGETCENQWMDYLLVEWVSQWIWCKITVINSVTANAVYCHRRGVQRVHLLLQKTGNGNSTTETITTTRAMRPSMRPTTAWTTTRAKCTSLSMHWERAIFVTLCSSCLTCTLMAQVWVSSLVIHVHVRFSLSSTFSSSTSTCPSLSSSFPSTSCTSSCTLSSTTWSPCKTCATPRTKGVTTPTTSPPPSQDAKRQIPIRCSTGEHCELGSSFRRRRAAASSCFRFCCVFPCFIRPSQYPPATACRGSRKGNSFLEKKRALKGHTGGEVMASESTSLYHEFNLNSFVTKEVRSIVLQFSSQDPSLEEEQAKMAE